MTQQVPRFEWTYDTHFYGVKWWFFCAQKRLFRKRMTGHWDFHLVSPWAYVVAGINLRNAIVFRVKSIILNGSNGTTSLPFLPVVLTFSVTTSRNRYRDNSSNLGPRKKYYTATKAITTKRVAGYEYGTLEETSSWLWYNFNVSSFRNTILCWKITAYF